MIYNEANSIISLELKNVFVFFIRKTVLHLGTVSRGVDLEESCCRRLSPRRRIYSEVKKKGRHCCLGDRID